MNNSEQTTLAERMASAARELQAEVDPLATAQRAVELLVRNVEGCDEAGVTLVYGKHRVETPAATGELAVAADRLQHEIGEGPALDTLWEQERIYVPDLCAEPRWPRWAARMTGGRGSAVC